MISFLRLFAKSWRRGGRGWVFNPRCYAIGLGSVSELKPYEAQKLSATPCHLLFRVVIATHHPKDHQA